MIKRILLVFVTLLAFQTFLTAQEKFEGKIKIKITSEGESAFMDYFIKDDDLRVDMKNEGQTSTVIIGAENSYMLMHEEKQYLNMDNGIFGKLQGLMGQNDDEGKDEKTDIKNFKTGKTKDILGYECEQWIFEDKEDGYEVEAWVTDELGSFKFKKNPIGNAFAPTWGASLNNSGYFPLLLTVKDEDSEIITRFEAEEVNKKSLDNSLFNPPSNYEEMKMPGMDGLF